MEKKSPNGGIATSKLSVRATIRQQLLATSIATCIAAPHVARAADASGEQPSLGGLEEVTVTATRRTESVIDVPFNVSAYDGNYFSDMGVTDLASLARLVPGLSIGQRDPAFAAQTVPIIRGLNVTGVSTHYPQAEQSPVTTYIGDVPVFGYLPLEDVERVEILRGPQGTLYGSGSLGGAIRIIPNRPKLDVFDFDVSAEGSSYAYAANLGYRTYGLVNIPIGGTLAFRADASYQAAPGYIDQVGVIRRGPGTDGSAVPILANSANVASSPGVFYSQPDVNYSGTATARAALLWQPMQAFQANLSYEHVRAFGNGFSEDNAGYPGGPDEIDPRFTQPALGNYQLIRRGLQPWTREVDFAALELSYDVGFATLNSATGYYDSKGSIAYDATAEVLNYGPPITQYYTGVPMNPRLLEPALINDLDHTVTEELRLVSNAGGVLDWTAGAFYLQQTRNAFLNYYLPGAYAQTVASASPYIVTTNPDGEFFNEYRSTTFKDISVFAEVTWHLSERLQLTGGVRQFRQTFANSISSASTVFDYNASDDEHNAASDHIFKLNASYKLVDESRLYATYSQGYRRGGVNGFALSGPVAELPSLLVYRPDKTDNYEIGIKGAAGNHLLYTFDVFYDNWQKAQFDTETPVLLWPVVVNSNGAHSKGTEFEVTVKGLSDRLTLSVSGDYSKAEFSSNLELPTALGTIAGTSGQRLPGSPEWSAALTAAYQQPWSAGRMITYSISANWSGDVLNDLPSSQNFAVLPAYSLWNASVTFGGRNGWRTAIFANNLFDKRVEYGAVNYPLAPEFDARFVGQPRQVGLRVEYRY